MDWKQSLSTYQVERQKAGSSLATWVRDGRHKNVRWLCVATCAAYCLLCIAWSLCLVVQWSHSIEMYGCV
jgi:hypothetical protein